MSEPDQIWLEAIRTLGRGKPFALATVVNVRGSTPREAGAKMIVRGDGQFGTIGGGCGEAEVFRKAQVLLEGDAGARLTQVDLTGDFDQDEIGSCGGIMDVFINLWSPSDHLPIAGKLADAAGRSRPAALLTLVDPGSRTEIPVGARALISVADPSPPAEGRNILPTPAMTQIAERAAGGLPALLEIGAEGSVKRVTRIEPRGNPLWFLDPIVGAQRLIIAGAGHIARPLAALGSMLGFHVTVIDDRSSFANRDRFRDADKIVVRPFGAALELLDLDRHSYVVSVTRGHAFDEETVRTALKTECGFVGMIGSRRRVRAMLERLEKQGIARERLEEVHAPLGLSIGAETAEEIAVSIMAEIIRERRAKIRDEFTLGTKIGRLRKTP